MMMTFEEVSNKYPVGSSIGYFHRSKWRHDKENTRRCISLNHYNSSFFVQEDNKYFNEVFINQSTCEGYYTIDGKDFTAYRLSDEGHMEDFEPFNSQLLDSYFFPPCDTLEEERKFLTLAWKENHPETPIFTVEDLEEVARYEF